MKIVADKSIPFIEGVFEPYADIIYKEGPAISREDLTDAEALIIRTRTKCDASLLDGTSVKIIATATSGTENIDVRYCQSHGRMPPDAMQGASQTTSSQQYSAPLPRKAFHLPTAR